MATEAGAVERSDYTQGIAFLQAGDWRAAIGCLEKHLAENPSDQEARYAIADARLKSSIDAAARARGRARVLRRLATLVPAGMILVCVMLIGLRVGLVLRSHLSLAMDRWRDEQRLVDLENGAQALVLAGDLDGAQAKYSELLTAVPDSEAAQQGLAQIGSLREAQDLYRRAVSLQEAGDWAGALQLFTLLQTHQSAYRDVALRIAAVEQQQRLDELLASAEANDRLGKASQALSEYQALRNQDPTYHAQEVSARLYALHMQLGAALLEQDPPDAAAVPQALDHFEAALTLVPRDATATQERKLGRAFLDAQAPYEAKQWQVAVSRLESLLDQSPDYLGGLAARMSLYAQHVSDGDEALEAGNCAAAHDWYEAAAASAVQDTTAALAGLSRAELCLSRTPTLTPTVPPSPTSMPPTAARLPTGTPARKPGATRPKPPTPNPTPEPELLPFTGRIVNGWARCDGFALITGFVMHASQAPICGISVAAWSDSWGGWIATTEENGKFDVLLSGKPSGTYYVAVVDRSTCTQADGQPVTRTCRRLSNLIEATVTAHCWGAGAVQVTQVSFEAP